MITLHLTQSNISIFEYHPSSFILHPCTLLMMISRQQYSHFVFAFILVFASAHGRLLHKTFSNEEVNPSGVLLSNDTITVKKVSLAIDPTYTGKTNYSDAVGLAALCTAFSWLLEENYDPCLPPIWSWIKCNSDPKPRVIALNLNSRFLFGELPDFSSMDALETIDLSNNALYEVIPSFLATFPRLKQLNLAYNFFYGLVPDSLACSKDIDVNVTGNTKLQVPKSCSPSPPASGDSGVNHGPSFQVPAARETTKKNNQPVILGSTISALALLWIAAGGFALYHHKSKAAAAVAAAAAADAPTQGVEEPKSGAGTPMEERPINNMTHLHS